MPEIGWRELYRAAILELDPTLFRARVKAAEDAITARAARTADLSRDERKDLEEALSALRLLKREQR